MTGLSLAQARQFILRGRWLFRCLAFSWGTFTAFSEKPSLDNIYPTVVTSGGTNSITLSGKFDPWPPQIWSSVRGLEFQFTTNKGSLQVTFSGDVSTGPALLRLFNDEGASEPAILVVSTESWIADLEPNNHFEKPQTITNFPARIGGRLDKNSDVDSFAFTIPAGQWLDARLESHTLMSKVDAVLRLVSPEGYQIAWNHDFSSFDPRLVYRAPVEEPVVLQVFGFAYPAGSEIMLSGGNGGVYQLHLATSSHAPVDLSRPLNESVTNSALPLEVFGAVCPAGDEDKFLVSLKKDQVIEAVADAMSFGSALDPWIKIEDAAGKELARNDDAEGSRNAHLEWKAPADGEYAIMVGSLTHQGYEDWRYKLTARIAEPDFVATVSASAFVLDPTGTNEIKVATKRLRNFTNELTLKVESLPDGVSAEPVKIDGKSGEGTLKLVTTQAPAFNGPIRILVEDSAANSRRSVHFPLVSRSENNGVPGGYSRLLVEQTDELWLTVKPTPAAKPATP